MQKMKTDQVPVAMMLDDFSGPFPQSGVRSILTQSESVQSNYLFTETLQYSLVNCIGTN